jgi:protein-S-isoprenylcysteine O-methyltransferase Ste14
MGSDKSVAKGNEISGIRISALLRWLVQTMIFILIFGSSLFLSSRQWDWGMAWAYLGLFITSQLIVGFFLVPKNPALVVERTQLKASPDAQWDRPLVGTATVWGPVTMLVVAGLDQRWNWTSQVPEAIQFSALGIAALGSLLTIWTMVSNRFFYGRVRIEKDRGHTVAKTGPYQSVRHPGYAGAIIFNLAIPLLLDSLWAFIPAIVVILALTLRTALEDRLLINELDGYQDYAQRVRHRLLPGIW